MTGALDPIPDLVSKIQTLQAAVYELQRRTTGATDPLSIGDMVDVQDDGLVDPTITKPDGSFLSWRASDGVWIPTAVAPGGGGQFPITDPVGSAELETSSGGDVLNFLGTDFEFDNSGSVSFNNATFVNFNSTGNVAMSNSGSFSVNSAGGMSVTVDISVFASVEIFADLHVDGALEVDNGWNLITSTEGFLTASTGIEISNVGGNDGVQIGNSGSDGSVFGLTQNDDGGFLFANNGAGMTIVNDAGGGFQVVGKLGFFGVTPVAQQSTPSTLPQVISLLQAYGLCP